MNKGLFDPKATFVISKIIERLFPAGENNNIIQLSVIF